MKKTILYIAPADSPHSERWIRAFLPLFDVIWVTFHPGKIDHIDGVKQLFVIDGGFIRTFLQLIEIRRSLKRQHIDVVHVHSLARYLVFGAVLGIRRGFVSVGSAWGSDILLPRFGVVQRLVQRLLARQLDFITADSDIMLEKLANLGCNRQKLRRINFGVETTKFVPKDEARFSGFRSLGHDGVSPVIVSLRNWFPLYRIDVLLNACALLSERGVDYFCVIFGWGPEEEKLFLQIAKLGLSEKCVLAGRFSHHDLPSILNSSAVYVSTSTSDAGIAASTAEAMACGVPVVISDNSENDRWIRDGVNGFLFETNSGTQLAKKIEKVIRLPIAERRAIGLAGREIIVDRNDYDREMRKVLSLYTGKSQ